MTLSRSFIRNAPTTPLDARLMLMGLVTANANGSPRTGVLGANPSLVSTTATMNLAVAAGEFVTSKGRGDGVSIFVNDGVVNVPVGAAPGSNSRIDVLYVKHNDDTTGDADALPIFGVVAGAAAASPVKPALPTGATELAQLRIYAGTTATNGGANVLTNSAQMTAARGGVVPFRTKAELDAWTTAPEAQVATVLATGQTYTRVGSAWTLDPHAGGILMRRSATAAALSNSTYTNLSTNTFWTQAARSGDFAAYSNGVIVPRDGIYRVSYSVATTVVSSVCGVTVNKSTGIGLSDLEIAAAGGTAQGIGVASASAEIPLTGGDVLRLFGIASASQASNWRVEPNLSIFQVEYVRAA